MRFSRIANDKLDIKSRTAKKLLNDAIQNVLRGIADNTQRNFTFANITEKLECSRQWLWMNFISKENLFSNGGNSL